MRTSATLEAKLTQMGLFDTEGAAASTWATAFAKYFEYAETSITHVPINGTSVQTIAKPAMVSGLAGLSTGGAAAIVAGLTAFWAAIVAAPPAFFAAATLATPPAGLANLAAALEATFAANIASSASKADAMAAIAGDIHLAIAGGTVTMPGAPPVVEVIL